MTRRLLPLTADAVERLPAPCGACLFWELGHPRPAPGASAAAQGSAAIQKQAWCAAQSQDGHPPGRLVLLDDEVAGYVLFAAAGSFVRRRPPVPSTSTDALVLATAWVAPHFREQGIGRALVQAAVKEALRRGLPAVEVYGDRRFREYDCVLPAMWLLREGFVVHREHPRYPVLRIDARRTVRWADSLEQALEGVRERLPHRAPAPAPSRQRH